MSGTNWKPELPSKKNLEKLLNEVNKINCDTKRAIILMCKLMKMQMFNDGNKRTAMLIANHELIKLGRGIISVSEENKVEFGTKLIEYYENEEKIESLIQFIYDKCLDGMTK
ncbi:MAG: Fic family protein [Clostridia bacterium]|nr:Fic family protein [Clostridia bacterium]